MNLLTSNTRSDTSIAQKLAYESGNTLALGCRSCPYFAVCGGLRMEKGPFDCLGFCCGKPQSCSTVCLNKPKDFVNRFREVRGFGLELEDVSHTQSLSYQLSDDIIPLIYHGHSRKEALFHSTLALRLVDLINCQTQKLRFRSRSDLCRHFRVDETAKLILTGVNHDHRIEHWWTLGDKRLEIINQLKDIGIEIVTTPNFSVFLDRPRTDDLHAMKRIAEVFVEFQEGGIPCALHPNGRTDQDFERWKKFICERDEVQILSYEFITGPSAKWRRDFHLGKLAMIAESSGRDLDIIIRGAPDVIPFLRRYYRRVFYVDSYPFMKAVYRQCAGRIGNQELIWLLNPTSNGAPIDSLLERNIVERTAYLKNWFYAGFEHTPMLRVM